MKVFCTLVVLLLFCMSAYSGLLGTGIQNPGTTLITKTDSTRVMLPDSIPNHSISINGPSNTVSITHEPSTQKNFVDNQKNPSNKIEINGEGNSVTIHQNQHAGQVTIQQNEKAIS